MDSNGSNSNGSNPNSAANLNINGDNDNGDNEMNADDQMMNDLGEIAAMQHYNTMLAAAQTANNGASGQNEEENEEDDEKARLYGFAKNSDALAQVELKILIWFKDTLKYKTTKYIYRSIF